VPDHLLEVALEIGRDVIVVEQRIVDIDKEDDRIRAVMPLQPNIRVWDDPR
jgi:hypothetical protein